MPGALTRLQNLWSPVRTEGRTDVRRGVGMLIRSVGGSTSQQLDAMSEVGTVFGIVDRIASSQAEIQWDLYRTSVSGREEDRTPVTRHLALERWRKPNEIMDGPLLVETCQQHYELTGTARIIVDTDNPYGIVMGMWPVRPDRIVPVPGTDTMLAGYIYTSADGAQIPLQPNEVLSVMRPHPKDSFNGLGAVQPSLVDIQTSRAAAEWNRNFFRNGALPGGVIEVPNELSDMQWTNLVRRWREGHRGVNRAHRIGTLEYGASFKSISFSVKDMMLTEIRDQVRTEIMMAWGISKHMLGLAEDVNRATAEAGEYMFAKYIARQRAARWRSMLNNFYLPLFGGAANNLAFDFDSPVPQDQELENKTRESQARAAKLWIDAGFEPSEVLDTVGAPPMTHTGKVPGAGTPVIPPAPEPLVIEAGKEGE